MPPKRGGRGKAPVTPNPRRSGRLQGNAPESPGLPMDTGPRSGPPETPTPADPGGRGGRGGRGRGRGGTRGGRGGVRGGRGGVAGGQQGAGQGQQQGQAHGQAGVSGDGGGHPGSDGSSDGSDGSREGSNSGDRGGGIPPVNGGESANQPSNDVAGGAGSHGGAEGAQDGEQGDNHDDEEEVTAQDVPDANIKREHDSGEEDGNRAGAGPTPAADGGAGVEFEGQLGEIREPPPLIASSSSSNPPSNSSSASYGSPPAHPLGFPGAGNGNGRPPNGSPGPPAATNPRRQRVNRCLDVVIAILRIATALLIFAYVLPPKTLSELKKGHVPKFALPSRFAPPLASAITKTRTTTETQTITQALEKAIKLMTPDTVTVTPLHPKQTWRLKDWGSPTALPLTPEEMMRRMQLYGTTEEVADEYAVAALALMIQIMVQKWGIATGTEDPDVWYKWARDVWTRKEKPPGVDWEEVWRIWREARDEAQRTLNDPNNLTTTDWFPKPTARIRGWLGWAGVEEDTQDLINDRNKRQLELDRRRRREEQMRKEAQDAVVTGREKNKWTIFNWDQAWSLLVEE